MKRGIITMSDAGIIVMPLETVWMTQFEIADLLGVFSCDIRKAIRSIYKCNEADKSKTMLYIKQADGVSFDTYNLEMIIAIAFRIISNGSQIFRKWVMQKLRTKDNNNSIQLLVSCNNPQNKEGRNRWKN